MIVSALLLSLSLALGTAPAAGPPDWFDPGTIRFVGGRYGDPSLEFEAVQGSLDGSDLVTVAQGRHVRGALRLAGGRVLLQTRRAGVSRYVVVEPDGSRRVLARDVEDVAISAGGGTLLVKRDCTLLRCELVTVRVSDGRTRRVLVATGWPVIGPDERSVAAGRLADLVERPIRVRFAGGPVRTLEAGNPIGFDARGRLVYQAGTILRHDPVTRRSTVLYRWDAGSTWMTPSGSRLLLVPRRGPPRLVVIDLMTGTRSVVPLADRDRELTDLGDDRFAVVVRRNPDIGFVEGFRVVDLVDLRTQVVEWHGAPEPDAGG